MQKENSTAKFGSEWFFVSSSSQHHQSSSLSLSPWPSLSLTIDNRKMHKENFTAKFVSEFVARSSFWLFLWHFEGLWIRWNFRENLWKSCNRKDWKLFQTQLCTFHWKIRYQWVRSGEKICLGRREIDIYWAAYQGSDDAPIYGLSTALATKWPKDKIEIAIIWGQRRYQWGENLSGEKSGGR